MSEVITANLPASDLGRTEAFYQALGFETRFKSEHWMIMGFGGTQVEFFPHPDIEPRESWFSACLRSDDIEALHAQFARAGLPREDSAIPRLTGIYKLEYAPRMFALVDEDGSLWRVLDETDIET